MADEINTPNHRYYQLRNHIKLAESDMCKSLIFASGIAKIDSFMISPLFAASEPGVWYDPSDLTTLFQDNAGTTPVTTPGQTVGLMLDKSQGLVLGPELVTNGDFSGGLTGWSIATGYGGTVVNNGNGTVTISDVGTGDGGITQSFTTVVGKTYLVQLNVISQSGGSPRIRVGISDGAFGNLNIDALSAYFIATATTTWVTPTAIQNNSSFVLDSVSVTLLAGNHATQPTIAQRPIYGINPIVGTRNLLTYTEQFDNAAWVLNLSTLSVNSSTAPDGTLTADKLIPNNAASGGYVVQNSSIISGQNYTFSFYGKPDGFSEVRTPDNGTFMGNNVNFNLSTGVATLIAGTATFGMTAAGNGWYRCFVSGTASATGSASKQIRSLSTGDGTSGILIWGAQLEQSSTATAYQKVVLQYEVTEAGVQSVSYLAFDGVDDGMVTNTITPGIDKAQVFAGVRKLQDAATAIIVELSANGSLSNGTMGMFAPAASGASSYRFNSKGDGIERPASVTNSIYNSPNTSVLVGIGDISAPNVLLRINGSQVAADTSSQGIGNYLANPIYIGRRGGTTFPLNGRLYSLITRFGANLTTGQITSTESWVNAKTGAY